MDLALFDYDLPAHLIAQEPAEPRDAARLLALDRASGERRDPRFADLPDLLRPGDCVVVNTTLIPTNNCTGYYPSINARCTDAG